MAPPSLPSPLLLLLLLLLAPQRSRGCNRTHGGGDSAVNWEQLGCGRPLAPPGGSVVRNVGGEDAAPGAWPWTGALLRRGGHVCGASLVAPEWVLTAAHCFQESLDPRLYSVLLGSQWLPPREGPAQGLVVPVDRVLPHGRYRGEATSGDIALVRLARAVPFGPRLLPLCLPPPGANFPPPGARCVATGWGEGSEGGAPRRLQELEVPVLALSTCRRLYGIDMGRALPPRRIHSDMVCAGYAEGQRDTCKGDSGGPLSCRWGSRWALAGIVSWGEGCGVPNRPGVYTRLSAYSRWVRERAPTAAFLPPSPAPDPAPNPAPANLNPAPAANNNNNGSQGGAGLPVLAALAGAWWAGNGAGR